ncbi:MAG: hypothetical protein QW374_04970 [Candidatus Bathyarchaeia archaeon]|nr:hypothetical protein [Candidatus Bathyarchaeota archaeon]
MILSERVWRILDEQILVSDSSSYNVANAVRDYDSNTYSTSSTSYVLVKTVTFNPESGGHIGVYKISYQTNQSSGVLFGVRVTAQETGGSEEQIHLDEHLGSATWVSRSFVINRCFGKDKSVTIRVYIRSGSSSYSGSIRYIEIIYHKKSYDTVVSKSFNLSSDSTLLLTFTASAGGACYIGVMIDNMYLNGEYHSSSISNAKKYAIFGLTPGQHTLSIIALSLDNITVTISNIILKTISFSDMNKRNFDVYSSSFQLNTSSRMTAIGSFRKTHLMIDLSAYTDDAETNIGSGTNYVKLKINNEEKTFNIYSYNGKRNHPAHGRLSLEVDVNTSYMIEVEKANTNTIVYISAWICPWIITYNGNYAPLLFRFPPGSTAYILFDPLFDDPVKIIRLDVDVTQGSGSLLWSYTFDIQEPEQSALIISGYGACISLVAVDVRV